MIFSKTYIIVLKKISLLLLGLFPVALISQNQTVGLLVNSAGSFEGYTLFAPVESTTTYLIDHCGNLAHSWESDYKPGFSVYLLENGLLLRPGKVNYFPPLGSGGYGGIIQILDWDSNVIWEYNYANDSLLHHHDVAYLPNGNILILARELKSMQEAIAAGRDPDVVTGEGIYAEHIVEVMPIGLDSGDIVWEWHIWDHLIQDYDPDKNNFGIVEAHPELININYHPSNNSADWLHFNSLDYNAELDQIMLCSRYNEEIYIIDHCTTSAEAQSHSGGLRGRGGDILFRWGNPLAYHVGFPEDQKLFRQHDAHWIPPDLPDEGKIMIFNNGLGRPVFYSSIDVIQPELDSNQNYFLNPGGYFHPEEPEIDYIAPDTVSFQSSYMGSAQRMPNGNTLITDSPAGRLFEIDSLDNIVWEYINPVHGTGVLSQGDPIPNWFDLGNAIFRSVRYSIDYPGFENADLVSEGPLELNSWDYECGIPTEVNTIEESDFDIYPNPTSNVLFLRLESMYVGMVRIWDIYGHIWFFDKPDRKGILEIDVSAFPGGIYLLGVDEYGVKRFVIGG